MHSEKSAISLSLKNCHTNPRLARNRFQVRNSVRPMHLFGHNLDHDYYFELPREGERAPQSITRCQLHTLAMSGLSRVRTELYPLLVIPSLAPHPVQTNGQSTGHGNLGDLPAPPHRQVEKLAAPFRIAAYRDLGRFHQ